MAKKNKKNTFKVTISNETIFIRNEDDFLMTEVDGEAVVMNIINGSYWGLNNTTTEIWNFLEKKASLQEIINMLLGTYEVEEATCRQETLRVIITMLQLNILKVETKVEA